MLKKQIFGNKKGKVFLLSRLLKLKLQMTFTLRQGCSRSSSYKHGTEDSP